MDPLLEDMVRHARRQVQDYYGADLWDADINWDKPVVMHSDGDGPKAPATVRDTEVSHAIGFICGVAAAMDLTPLMLLDQVRDIDDPDVRRELTVATAQLNGTVIDTAENFNHRFIPIPDNRGYCAQCGRGRALHTTLVPTPAIRGKVAAKRPRPRKTT